MIFTGPWIAFIRHLALVYPLFKSYMKSLTVYLTYSYLFISKIIYDMTIIFVFGQCAETSTSSTNKHSFASHYCLSM